MRRAGWFEGDNTSWPSGRRGPRYRFRGGFRANHLNLVGWAALIALGVLPGILIALLLAQGSPTSVSAILVSVLGVWGVALFFDARAYRRLGANRQ